MNAIDCRRSLVICSIAGALALTACSSEGQGTSREDGPTQARQAIVKGQPSDATDDEVVMITHHDPEKRELWSCTGTLIAPRLAITAAHCLAHVDTSFFVCMASGEASGGKREPTLRPETMFVYKGAKRLSHDSYARVGPTLAKPDGVGMQILTDGVENICNHDLAIIVLKEPVAGAKIAPIRLDGDVSRGEQLYAVGYGYIDDGSFPQVRQRRDGVRVLQVGPFTPRDQRAPLPPNEFLTSESICYGDSGGPAFAVDTRAIVGVVTRGGEETNASETNRAAACLGATNVFTKLSPFKDLIMEGFRLTGAEPWLEGTPEPLAQDAGTACVQGDECAPAGATPAAATTSNASCSVNALGHARVSPLMAIALAALTTLRRRRPRTASTSPRA